MATVQGYRVQQTGPGQSLDVSEVFRDVVENDVKYVLANTTLTKWGPGVNVLDEYGDTYIAYCVEDLDRLLMLREATWRHVQEKE